MSKPKSSKQTCNQTRPEVVGLHLNGSPNKAMIGIAWSVLEEGDGGVIQIVYKGDPSVRASVRGVVVGQRTMQKLEFTEKVLTPSESYESSTKSYKASGLAALGTSCAVVLAFLIVGIHEYRRGGDMNKFFASLRQVRWLIVPLFVLFGLGVYFLWIKRDPGPPFGF